MSEQKAELSQGPTTIYRQLTSLPSLPSDDVIKGVSVNSLAQKALEQVDI